jgi:hypothetical protein
VIPLNLLIGALAGWLQGEQHKVMDDRHDSQAAGHSTER